MMTQAGSARSPVIWVTLFLAAICAVFIVAIMSKPAEAATARSIEAERMKGAGKVYGNRSASNNRAKVIYRNRATYKWVKGSIRTIAVRTRGDRCGKPPRMKVTVDGKRVMVRWIRNQKRWRYQVKRLRTSYGPHKIKVKFTNNRKTRKCDRNLRVDKVYLRLIKKRPDPPNPVALGVYLPGIDPAKLDNFKDRTNSKPATVMWYQDWVQKDTKNFRPVLMDAVTSRGAVPMVTWEPWDWNGGKKQEKYALSTIIAGDHDPYIRKWAKDAAAWNKTMYLRFAHEMNGSWYSWSPGVNGNTTKEYIQAWRHVHNIFREEGATKVRWVWSPNVQPGTPKYKYTELYPGDEYVDWMALDGYNWGNTQKWSSWKTFSQVFGASYSELVKISNKPIMIAETASAEKGGDKAYWIRQSLLKEVPSKFPRVRAVVWFNHNKEADWRVNSSLGALKAYKEAAGTTLYSRRLQ